MPDNTQVVIDLSAIALKVLVKELQIRAVKEGKTIDEMMDMTDSSVTLGKEEAQDGIEYVHTEESEV